VVSDIRMPPTGTDEGIQVAAQLRQERPDVGVVLLSQHADAAYALRLLEGGSGGRAYLLKERVGDVGELTSAVRQVAEGGSVIDATVVEQLVAANRGQRQTPLSTLTPRELEVLEEMAQGKSNAAIAASLVLSERAIEKHTNSIFSKLGLTEERDLNRRVKAVLVYLHDHTRGQGG
jgi:DNA-binding NarL/FixJ family response regulator